MWISNFVLHQADTLQSQNINYLRAIVKTKYIKFTLLNNFSLRTCGSDKYHQHGASRLGAIDNPLVCSGNYFTANCCFKAFWFFYSIYHMKANNRYRKTWGSWNYSSLNFHSMPLKWDHVHVISLTWTLWTLLYNQSCLSKVEWRIPAKCDSVCITI